MTIEAGAERHASWLELFFDLVFVATAGQLVHMLHGDPGPASFLVVLAVFFPAWWAWVNLTVYTNLFGQDCTWVRLQMLIAMIGLAAMSVAIPDVFGGRGWLYALGYAITRGVLLQLWWPATHLTGPERVPPWRPIVYAGVTGGLWLVSMVVPAPGRYGIWAVAVVLELGIVLLLRERVLLGRVEPAHLVERVGLFMIIVLGESVLGVIRAVDQTWTLRSAGVALAGFVLLAALWWTYFDYGSTANQRMLHAAGEGRTNGLIRDTLFFLHFFVVAGVVSLAAGLGTSVAVAAGARLPPGTLWAIAGGLAVYHAAHVGISLRYGHSLPSVLWWAVAAVGVPLGVAVLGAGWPPLPVVAGLACWAVALVAYTSRMGSVRGGSAGSAAGWTHGTAR